MDKKNFCYKNIDYTVVIGVRNYIEFYRDYKLTINMVRTRIYKGFGKTNDFAVLEQIAQNYLDKWLFDAKPIVKPINKLYIYIEDNRYRYRPKTFICYNGIIKKYSLWCEKNKINIDTITPMQAQKYISDCANAGTSNTTLSNYKLILSFLYAGMSKMQMVHNNAFENLPKIKRTPKSLQHFSKSHIEAITNYCKDENPQLLLAIKILYSCFIRPGEMQNLQLYDINLEDRYIQINASYSKNKKTQKVLIPDTLLKDLQFIKNYNQSNYLLGSNGVPGSVKIGNNYLNKTHCKILKKLKINGNYAFYSWKHTGVIQAVRNGVNMKTLQLQLRHHSLDMVNEYLKNLGIMDDMDTDNKLPTL
jgi:integrase